MANVNFVWTLPSTRADGKALSPSEIANVEILFGLPGLPATSLGKFSPGTLSTSLNDVEPGDYIASAFVTDTQNPPAVSTGRNVLVNIPVPRLAVPGDVTLTVNLS